MHRFEGKRVLITGGTGSFGRAATQRLLQSAVREVRVFSRDERKQWEMMDTLRDDRVTFILGDIRNLESVRAVVQGIEIVFHAAALKYVPRCEYNVYETVLTNVIGAANLVAACKEASVRTCVGLSTDKAVLPVNAYGASKNLMEKLFVNANMPLGGFPTRFILVRYGNVIGSSGSVIPFFVKQISVGGPVTITDPCMTRFWFILDQAVHLAFNAAIVGVGGEIFVRKIPAATMADVAAVLIGTTGVELEVIGTRPGEKTHELLISENEAYRTVEIMDGFAILPEIPLPGIKAFYGTVKGITGAYSSKDATINRKELATLLAGTGWL